MLEWQVRALARAIRGVRLAVLVLVACFLVQTWRVQVLLTERAYESLARQRDAVTEAYWEWERLATSGPAQVRPGAREQAERLEWLRDTLLERQLVLADKLDFLTFGRGPDVPAHP